MLPVCTCRLASRSTFWQTQPARHDVASVPDHFDRVFAKAFDRTRESNRQAPENERETLVTSHHDSILRANPDAAAASCKSLCRRSKLTHSHDSRRGAMAENPDNSLARRAPDEIYRTGVDQVTSQLTACMANC
jgi:hypothetical protein